MRYEDLRDYCLNLMTLLKRGSSFYRHKYQFHFFSGLIVRVCPLNGLFFTCYSFGISGVKRSCTMRRFLSVAAVLSLCVLLVCSCTEKEDRTEYDYRIRGVEGDDLTVVRQDYQGGRGTVVSGTVVIEDGVLVFITE